MEEVSQGAVAPDVTSTPSVPQSAPEPIEPKSGGIQSEIRLAAQRLAQRRQEKRAEAAAAQEATAPAPTESPPAQEGAATPAEQPPSGETQEDGPVPVEEPSINPPRSWTSDDHEAFKALPREVQARLVEIDRTRELEVRKVQNEIAEQRRADEASRAAMEQARQQYESSLAYALELAHNSDEFADIKTQADVTRLARDDWPRYCQYDARQKEIQQLSALHQEAQQRQWQEQVNQWSHFASQEDQTFATKYPDAATLKEDAVGYLRSAGFSDKEIQAHWNSPAWRDHRMQGVMRDAVLYQKAQKARAEAVKKPVPPVQRPGVAQNRPAPNAEEIKTLESMPSLNLRQAARLNMLRNERRA